MSESLDAYKALAIAVSYVIIMVAVGLNSISARIYHIHSRFHRSNVLPTCATLYSVPPVPLQMTFVLHHYHSPTITNDFNFMTIMPANVMYADGLLCANRISFDKLSPTNNTYVVCYIRVAVRPDLQQLAQWYAILNTILFSFDRYQCLRCTHGVQLYVKFQMCRRRPHWNKMQNYIAPQSRRCNKYLPFV